MPLLLSVSSARGQGLDPARPFAKGTRRAASNRLRRTQRAIGRLHAKIADGRRDHHHQLTARLVAGAQVICIEDLAVKAMARSMGRRAFRRSVADAGLGEIRRQLAYKAAWRGRVVSIVGRFYPSSKTCGACGQVHAGLMLSDRRWVCPACGANHHRDLNAAKNIEREGLRLLAAVSGRPERTRRSRGTDARGEYACAVGGSSPAGQPSSWNRELNYRAASPRPTRERRDRLPLRVETPTRFHAQAATALRCRCAGNVPARCVRTRRRQVVRHGHEVTLRIQVESVQDP